MRQEPELLVCGEALMDVYTAGDSETGLVLDARVGGSPFNVAVAAARLDLPVAYFGTLSKDSFGERLLRALRADGVDTRAVQRSEAPTTLSVVGVDGRGQPSYTFHGERGADRQLFVNALTQIPAGIRALHVGSYAMIVDPVATTLRMLLDQRRHEWLIAWDPNVRLGVVSDAARWRELLEWMLPRTHLLKLSTEDLAVLAPSTTPAEFAARAVAHGVRLVALTDGANGASAWHADGGAHIPAAALEVVDTVGAGDAFQGALLAWLAQQGRLSIAGVTSLPACEAVLRFAVAAAGLTCTRRGADFPRLRDVVLTR